MKMLKNMLFVYCTRYFCEFCLFHFMLIQMTKKLTTPSDFNHPLRIIVESCLRAMDSFNGTTN